MDPGRLRRAQARGHDSQLRESVVGDLVDFSIRQSPRVPVELLDVTDKLPSAWRSYQKRLFII